MTDQFDTTKRSHPRVRTELSVKLRAEDGQSPQVGTISNLSLGGVFLEMAQPLAFGTECSLDFSLDGGQRVQCKGFVVWTTKTEPERAGGKVGCGMRLMDIGIADMRALADFVEASFGQT